MASPGSVIGRTLGRYRVSEPIGAGGMGEVYRAYDQRLERDVALKLLAPGALADDSARQRFRKEALALSRLNHPNIATVHDFDTHDGIDFLVTELVPGVTLDEKLASGPLPESAVIRIGLQLADGLEAAHRQGVIHRDLKPGNLRLTPEGRLKILDFGLAKRVDPADQVSVTQSVAEPRGPVGTLAYMAPEQLQGEKVDARTDLWAAGVVLYELATGRRPFESKTSAALAAEIIHAAAPAPQQLQPKLSLALTELVLKCLDKDPTRRYQTAGELRAALQAIQSGTAATAPGVRYPVWRRRWLAGVIAAVVVLVIATALGLNRMRTLLGGAPRIQSLAVLPLTNLSGDPQQEYFADGMTEELITDLGRLTGLKKVIARGSVMRYKGSNKPLSEIARELNVDALITGAVLRAGDRVRITAQLINPETQAQLWSQHYEERQSDVLLLQNEVTQAIASEIRLKLSADDQARLATARSVNPEALDAYLQGRFHMERLSRKEIDTAEKYFQLALEKDPNYALAYADGIGRVWALRCNLGQTPCSEANPKWKQATLKAAELDPTLPDVQINLAGIRFYVDWDWAEAGKELRRAVESYPSDHVPHVWYAEYLLYIAGRPEEGLAEMRRILELDPHNSLYQAWVGQALRSARHDDEAIAYLQQVLRADPNAPLVRNQLANALANKHRYEEALAMLKAAAAAGEDTEAVEAFDRGYAQGGYRGAMRARAELAVRRSSKTYVAPTSIARFFKDAGEKELALDWLEKAYEERNMQMSRINDPQWDSLRDHPRFQALLRRMNLQP